MIKPKAKESEPLKEVRDAKDAEHNVDAASDAERLRLRDKWTRD